LRHGAFLGVALGVARRSCRISLAAAAGKVLGHTRAPGSLGRACGMGGHSVRGLPKEGEGKAQSEKRGRGAIGASQQKAKLSAKKKRAGLAGPFAVIALWLALKFVSNSIATRCVSVCFTVSSAGKCSVLGVPRGWATGATPPPPCAQHPI
jgi:hypothetical protein